MLGLEMYWECPVLKGNEQFGWKICMVVCFIKRSPGGVEFEETQCV